MSFLDPLFFVFIGPVLLAVAMTHGRARLILLIASAYIFYAASYPPYVLVLIAGTLFDFWTGNGIEASKTQAARRFWMGLTLASNLGVLALFKYLGFVIDNLNELLRLSEIGFALPRANIGLPLGISFFTFQSLSYTIDIYRRQIKAADSLLEFAAFISFFPHLVAGPIIRARDFLPQLRTMVPLNEIQTRLGIGLILVGYFKKAVVGDNAGTLVDPVFMDPSAYGGLACWLGAIFFAIQIYADFSGYTDVATGLSLLLGIRLRENFHWPYLSESIRDFWRRWHMSLSFFLRDYLYHSLGGDRVSKARTTVNLFIVWFLGGLWHGAAWHFVAWGLYHGTLVSLGRILYGTRASLLWRFLTMPGRVAVTFLLVTLGWVLFRAENLGVAWAMWVKMAQPTSADWSAGTEAFFGAPLLLAALAGAVHIGTYLAYRHMPMRTPFASMRWLPMVIALAAVVILALSGDARRFIYFDF